MSQEQEHSLNTGFLQNTSEIRDNLSPPQLEVFQRSIVEEIVSYPPKTDRIIPVLIVGPTSSGKTVAASQILEGLRNDDSIIRWEKETETKIRTYYFDLGGAYQLALKTELVYGAAGAMTPEEYEKLSERKSSLEICALTNLRGPAVAFFDGVYITARYNARDKIVGIQRGGLRGARKMMVNMGGRCIVIVAPEDLRDKIVDLKEKAQASSEEEIISLLEDEGVEYEERDPRLVKASYTKTGNRLARERGDEEQLRINYALIKKREIIRPDLEQLSLPLFRRYFQEHREEWTRLQETGYYPLWLKMLFQEENPKRGFIMRNPALEEGIIRHHRNRILEASNIINALGIEARKRKSQDLIEELNRLGVEVDLPQTGKRTDGGSIIIPSFLDTNPLLKGDRFYYPANGNGYHTEAGLSIL